MTSNKTVHWLLGLLLLPWLLSPPALAGDGTPLASTAEGETPATLGGSPFEVHSRDQDGLLVAEVRARLDEPFARIEAILGRPASWCEFLPLVFNVKSCVFRREDAQNLLTIYVGRKFFESPQEAIPLDYAFRIVHRDRDRLRVQLSAPQGPWGTSDYHIELQARATADGRTDIRLHSSFRPSWRSTLATRAYLATAGRGKVGFSVEDYDGGEPVYVGGVKGIIERNAMRYYLALKAFLDTLNLPAEERFEARLEAWYGFTEKYRRQLYEMDRQDYLEVKRQERAYQLQLQGAFEGPAGKEEMAGMDVSEALPSS